MSKYTTEVRYVCEYYADKTESVGYDEVDSVIEAAIPHIFENFDIYDESYRPVLEKKILRHFYTREIGYETVGLWKLHLNNKLNEIMPYYNKLYESAALDFNPLNDVNYTVSHEGTARDSESGTDLKTLNTQKATTNTGTIGNTEGGTTAVSGSSQDTSSGQSVDKYSDTPQGGITGLIGDETTGQQYLTNARVINTSDSSSGSNSQTTTHGKTNTETLNTTETTNDTGTVSGTKARTLNSTDEYVNTISGKMGVTSYSKLLKEYRETLINIDLQIINELNDLFFILW